MKKITDIRHLQTDPNNLNKGTEYGDYLLEESFRKYGAGRSGLCDKNGVMIAGNHAFEKAVEMGMPVRVVETTGNEWVVVQRIDLDLETDKAARELSIVDNRTQEVGLNWSEEDLAKLDDIGIDLHELGWSESELERFQNEIEELEREKDGDNKPDKDETAALKKKIEKANYMIDSMEFEELKECKLELENLLYILEIKVAQIK